MSRSISATGSTCFNVTAANVTLNCNGFSITGTNATNTYGVYSSQLNTTIQNCLIQNFTYAIYFNGSSNGTISNDTLLTTHNTGYALYLANASNNNTVANITAMSNAYVGVGITASSNNTVANSTITSNTSNALFLIDANNSNIFNNTFISTAKNKQLVVMLNQSTNNLFALDNFTQTSAARPELLNPEHQLPERNSERNKPGQLLVQHPKYQRARPFPAAPPPHLRL